jgi:hypothetical protein
MLYYTKKGQRLKIIGSDFYSTFKNRKFFTREELYDHFKRTEKDLNSNTFTWRIFELKKKNIIQSAGKNLFTISDKSDYKPNMEAESIEIAKLLINNFESLEYCISDTGWLNEFTVHQAFKKHIIVEVEKDIVDSVYYYFKDNTEFDLFIDPDSKTVDFYISESNNAVIVKKMISRSPLRKIESFMTPSLEKILVDLFCDSNLYYMYQGSELIHIFENSIKKYRLNFTVMLGYSERRGAKIRLKEFLNENISDLTKGLIND